MGKLERNHADAIASARAAINALALAGIGISKDEVAYIFWSSIRVRTINLDALAESGWALHCKKFT